MRVPRRLWPTQASHAMKLANLTGIKRNEYYVCFFKLFYDNSLMRLHFMLVCTVLDLLCLSPRMQTTSPANESFIFAADDNWRSKTVRLFIYYFFYCYRDVECERRRDYNFFHWTFPSFISYWWMHYIVEIIFIVTSSSPKALLCFVFSPLLKLSYIIYTDQN